jgi:ABC-type antimicrobial peptide transport system permease subunit
MASTGAYGVMNYLVSQRTREFGIHLDVGATAADVLSLVLGRAATLSAGFVWDCSDHFSWRD